MFRLVHLGFFITWKSDPFNTKILTLFFCRILLLCFQFNACSHWSGVLLVTDEETVWQWTSHLLHDLLLRLHLTQRKPHKARQALTSSVLHSHPQVTGVLLPPLFWKRKHNILWCIGCTWLQVILGAVIDTSATNTPQKI